MRRLKSQIEHMTDQTISSTVSPSAATVRDYFELMKPRIMMLVVFTAAAGLVAAPVDLHPITAFTALLSVALGSGAAGAVNMWFDADIDAVMTRTSTRPLPSGRVQPSDALALGIFMSILSVTLMTLATNWQAGALLAFSIFFYAVIYTMWLKRSTPQNIVIGGAAGAFPPVIGWAAATGTMPLEAWALFALTFVWTPPHFWALSLVANKDYAKAGVPMMPVVHGARNTRIQIFAYTQLMLVVSALPTLFGTGGLIYTLSALIGGVVFLGLAARVMMSRAGDADMEPSDRKAALSLFAFSIFYLALLFGAIILEHVTGLHDQLPRFALLAGL